MIVLRESSRRTANHTNCPEHGLIGGARNRPPRPLLYLRSLVHDDGGFDERGGQDQPDGSYGGGPAWLGREEQRRRAGAAAVGAGADPGGPFTGSGGGACRNGAADLAGLGASLQRPGCSGALLDPDRRASVLSERGTNGGVEGGGDQRPRSRDGQSCPLALRRFA